MAPFVMGARMNDDRPVGFSIQYDGTGIGPVAGCSPFVLAVPLSDVKRRIINCQKMLFFGAECKMVDTPVQFLY